MTDDSIEMQGHAKVNLGLDVVGRLPNGYHEVKMVMQTVGQVFHGKRRDTL